MHRSISQVDYHHGVFAFNWHRAVMYGSRSSRRQVTIFRVIRATGSATCRNGAITESMSCRPLKRMLQLRYTLEVTIR